MLPQLPVELTDIVIDFLWGDKLSLASCSLVCHDWLATARFHLFHTVILHSDEHSPTLPSFITFLKASSSGSTSTGGHIRVLHLGGDNKSGDRSGRNVLTLEAVVDILTSAFNVHTLVLRTAVLVTPNTEEFLVTHLSCIQSVRHLVLDAICLDDWYLPPFLGLFEHLVTLEIAEINLYPNTTPHYVSKATLALPPLNLNKIVCTMDGRLSILQCIEDLSRFYTTFTTLEVIYTKVAFILHDSKDLESIITSPVSSKLSNIILDFSCVEDFHECNEYYAEGWSSDFLSMSENICSLELALAINPHSPCQIPEDNLCYQVTQWKSALAILQSPPHNIKFITFAIVQSANDNYSGIKDILGEVEWSKLETNLIDLPHLHSVTIRMKVFRDSLYPYLSRLRKMLPQLQTTFSDIFPRLKSQGKLRFA